MSKITLTCNNSTKSIIVKDDETLLDTLAAEGVVIGACCGGLGKCGKCKIIVDGEKVLACQCKAQNGQKVELINNMTLPVEKTISSSCRNKNCNMVVDIGTTTINAAAINDDGVIISSYNAVNPQVSYGADVIARIVAANDGKIVAMQKCVVSVINKAMEKFSQANCLKDNCVIYIAANTVMLHILFGYECRSLGEAPYTPIFLNMRETLGHDLGVDCQAKVVVLPGISTYVGADIVAGIHYVGNPSKGKYNILLDLGTNAEMAIFNESNCYVTAAAAGPCFEGAGISCGMSATAGAIYKAVEKCGSIFFNTINDVEPCGICGTGLMDIIAIMNKLGAFDEYGTMDNEEFAVMDNISLNQQDVRQFQLAKSAIYSALKVMLKKLEIDYCDIENLYISGGFSAQMDVDNAVSIGLVDVNLKSKCKAVENSCLGGLIKYATFGGELSKITEHAQYLDMSCDIEFANEFVENMNFIGDNYEENC